MDELIKKLPICKCCAARLAGHVDSKWYSEPAGPDLADGSKGMCGLCVGLLQKDAVEKLRVDVENKFSSYVYPPGEAWTFNLILPVSTVFRNFVFTAICEREKAYDKYAKAGARSLGHFNINLDIVFPAMDKHDHILKLLPDERKWFGNFKKRKRNQNRKPTTDMNHSSVTRALQDLGPTEIGQVLGGSRDTLEQYLFSPLVDAADVPDVDKHLQLKVKLEREAHFMLGRYNKYSRELTQTPWVLDGERKTPDSVEELVAAPIIKAFGCKDFKFHSAGREDVDVRMLGNGRDFVLEMFDPHHPSEISMEELEKQVAEQSNGRVTINRLEETDKGVMIKLHRASEQHRKVYSALVWTERILTPEEIEKLNSVKDIDVNQKTPVRVLHRRPNMDRAKKVMWLDATQFLDNKHFLTLRLETSAGTYVKEFCHGDMGRTMPNLGSLLNMRTDILHLDVENLLEDDNLKLT